MLTRVLPDTSEDADGNGAVAPDDDDDLMFSSSSGDSVKLHMLNPATWPEVLRLYLTQEDRLGLIEATHRTDCLEALERLKTSEYASLSAQHKLALLRLLCDEVSATKMMAGLMNDVNERRVAVLQKRNKEIAATARSVRDWLLLVVVVAAIVVAVYVCMFCVCAPACACREW